MVDAQSYKVTATERNNEKSAEFETRSLFYLLNYHVDRNEIYFFVIDFFNDVSGVDRLGDKIWDIQSKGKFATGSQLGTCLVTLFKNYISAFSDKFVNFILYVQAIDTKMLIDPSKNSFGISNFTDDKVATIKQGLVDEALSKSYIKEFNISDFDIIQKAESFLKIVHFVVDSKTKAELIKDSINIDSSIYPSESYLDSIFKEIRNTQSSKKNITTEGVVINNVSDFTKYSKFIKAGEIALLITSRLINMDLSKDKKIPPSFAAQISKMDEREKSDFIEDCVDGIYRMMFDKNNVVNYWKFFENVWKTVKHNPPLDIEELYSKLDRLLLSSIQIDMNSIKYFVAMVKDGRIK